jgi:hypothetical protein
MRPGSSISNLGGVPGSVPEGATDGATTAIQDINNPTNFVTGPLGEAGKLPFVSTLAPTSLTNTAVSTQNVNATATAGSGIRVLPGSNKAGSTSASGSTGGNLANNFTDQVKKAVDKVTGGLTAAKPASSNASN